MFLPVTPQELGGQADIIYVIGEAYVDHPSFGHAIISRIVEREGLKIAILAQPQSDKDYLRFGEPKYGFLVTGGVVDSMVNNYTVAKIRRSRDVYSEGGEPGKRPDRCVDVYCKNLKRLFPESPVVIGGIEASLRRFAHYDYWADKIMPSLLIDSGADILIYGMGEKQTAIIARRLNSGENIKDMRDIKGTCYAVPVEETPLYGAECPSFENVSASKREYAVSCRIQHDEQDHIRGKIIKQRHGKMMLVQNIPMEPLTSEELDKVYALPYTRTYHPMYQKDGGVPGLSEVE